MIVILITCKELLLMSFVTKNFHITELECPCCQEFVRHEAFITALQRLREAMNIPFSINSGYRCAKHNRAVGGGRNSRHKKGAAVDISTIGWSGYDLFKFLKIATDKKIFHGQSTGVGIYPNFVHFDVRLKQTAWVGQ